MALRDLLVKPVLWVLRDLPGALALRALPVRLDLSALKDLPVRPDLSVHRVPLAVC